MKLVLPLAVPTVYPIKAGLKGLWLNENKETVVNSFNHKSLPDYGFIQQGL